MDLAELKKYSKDKKIKFQWVLVVAAMEKLLGRICREAGSDNIILLGDCLDLEVNQLPVLEIVVKGLTESQLLSNDFLAEPDSNEEGLFTISRSSQVDFLEMRDVLYRVDASLFNYNCPFNMRIIYQNDANKYVKFASLKENIELKGLLPQKIISNKGLSEGLNESLNEGLIVCKRYSNEGIFVDRLHQFVNQGELINNMRALYDLYKLGSRECLEGMHLRELLYLSLYELSEKDQENIEKEKPHKLCESLEFLKNNSSLDSRWRSFLRTSKVDVASFSETISMIEKIVEPIEESIENGQDFFGSWMPELQRYID